MSTAAAPCELLPWDSDFWGVQIGRVSASELTQERLAAIDAWSREVDVDCLYFLASADAPESWSMAEQAGFRLVDIRIELERPSAPIAATSSCRPATSADLAALETIARLSHGITRFYADSHFPADRADEFYATWIRKSVEAGFADEVLVVDHLGVPSGYVTCHAEAGGSTGSIGLIAVEEAARGNGFGAALVLGAVDWCHQRGLPRTTVVTQGRNIAAQRTFQRAGFITSSAGIWFHRWTSEAP